MRGLGRIFERPLGSGHFWIAYYHRGQEIRESVARLLDKPPALVTRADAERALKGRLREVLGGRFVRPNEERVTVAELLSAYRTHLHLKGVKSVRAIEVYLRLIERAWGPIHAVDVITSRVEEWMRRLLDEGYARGSVNLASGYLRAALKLARRQERLSQVPSIPSLKVRNAREGFFEREEFDALVARLRDPIDDVARFGYLTGWRVQEILGITWAMVDRVHQRIVLRDSKNDDGRVLPLVGELAELIERRWATRVVDGTTLSEWVFHRRGRRVKNFYGAWRTACQRAGVPGKLFHDFRRTAARDLVDAGYDPFTAMQITGHRSLSVFQRYRIVDTRRIAEALKGVQARRALEPARVVQLETDKRRTKRA